MAERDYYEVMGVPKSATQEDVRKAFKDGVLSHHPDKQGDAEKLKEFFNAYEVLSDPEKRRNYDNENGEDDDLEEGDGRMPPVVSGNSDDELLSALIGESPFGGSGSELSESEDDSNHSGEDTEYEVEVSLEDLYLGTVVKYTLAWEEFCSKCNGEGGVPSKCPCCKGRGLEVEKSTSFLLGTRTCNECQGTGNKINDKNRCLQCKGEKIVEEERIFEILVEKGMQHGQKITLPRQPDEMLGTIRGDFIFVLCEKDHLKFKRTGRDDLFVEHTLSNFEALSGFQFVLPHLDGRKLLIKSQPGEVVKHDFYKAVDKEGMPTFKNHSTKGNLYIHFIVVQSSAETVPPMPESDITGTELAECEETTLRDVEIEDEMQRRRFMRMSEQKQCDQQ